MNIKEEICKVGQKMYDKGFVAANDGNISVRVDTNEIIITPTGVSKGDMTPDILIQTDLDGNVIGGNGRPSSEIKMHLQIYKKLPHINAVVHAHPPIATAFAASRMSMEYPIICEAVVNLGVVPVTEYALPGSVDVPRSIVPFIEDYNAVLLANHGLLTWGEDLQTAFFRHESVEHYGKILMYTLNLGNAKPLNEQQVSELIKIRESLGITTGGVPKAHQFNA